MANGYFCKSLSSPARVSRPACRTRSSSPGGLPDGTSSSSPPFLCRAGRIDVRIELNMTFNELVGNAILGIDTLWGGDVMCASGTGRFIADSWFSDEPLPAAYVDRKS